MKNFNLTLVIVPNHEIEVLNTENELLNIYSAEWLRKKSLSTKSIKNYKSVIDCITGIIKDNIPVKYKGKIEIKENLYLITTENAPIILDIIKNFSVKYKLAIQTKLSQILYVYELKTFNEIIKEINSHLKVLTDYLNQLHDDLSLLIVCEY